jgi:hypothetical protein
MPNGLTGGRSLHETTADGSRWTRRARARGPLAALLAGLLALGAAVPRTPAPGECLLLDDFSKSAPGQFPAGWRARDEDGRPVYAVREESGRRFLRAVSKGVGIQAGREVEWDLNAYPVLAWSWRPQQFARGGDERSPGTNDSALAVYLLVPHSRTRGPRAVKYIWSERVPVGTRLESNGGLTKVNVLRSGPSRPGAWVEERVNALADYRRAFGAEEMPKPAGIAVLTDADDTKSTAAGDYANFRACRG